MMKLNKKMIASFILTLSLVTTTSAFANTNTTSIKNDEPTSYRINKLKETAMYYYWNGGDLKKAEAEIFKGITLKGKYDVVENAFAEAIHLDPFDNDLKFSLASTQIIQKKVPEALETYKGILNLDPNNFNANLLYGAYSKTNGDQKTYDSQIAKLKKLDEKKANDYIAKIASADSYMKTTLNKDVPKGLPQKDHAIVILGYALADDGTMREPLIGRLEAGLTLAKQYPNSTIIVSGGVPKNGVTEADAMSKWLIEKGVDKNRIILENKATDTVENALFSISIMEREGLKDMTLVSSASHMRRGLTVFKEASDHYAKLMGKEADRKFTNMVFLDYKSLEEAHQVPNEEKMVIYRDLLRTSGIWAYPGLQR
ncbi:YdcF family protein [Brevibacillus daliensis]|uniref:YdcF family protein n=1 Tax=Brevibacillus daliensis TaxID=2892995 RepID=UPI001E38FA00|nr:YdcF family protein [Brevibacillus daliensis]